MRDKLTNVEKIDRELKIAAYIIGAAALVTCAVSAYVIWSLLP